ncbi:hypothetical protein [Paenibacillus sp. GP183]|uniref:hypothetical protein n=1 Tax=Paenibacillus sp. GP183 TaxID=1882751 RepID=UPI0011153D02|nr:hypothetical protein [Paenibacillus sp. GP183]
MKIGLRVIASLLSPFLVGFYAAFLTYFFRDPARPFGFEKEYFLGVLISLALNLIVVIWLSIGIDQITKTFGLFNRKGYFFKFIIYTFTGCLPVIISWLKSSNPHSTLFYPQATFFPLVSLIYFHVLLGLDALLNWNVKNKGEHNNVS